MMATLNGTPNDDTLTGTAGDDTIFGGEGRDTIHGGAGNDRIDLGIGNRTGPQQAFGEGGQDILIGGESDDSLDGGTDNDVLYGNGGNDRLDGGAGDDTLFGGAGEDYFNDFQGANIVDGGDGEDFFEYVSYNPGQSRLTGGAGVDTFRLYGEVSRGAPYNTWAADIVTDFQAGNSGDIIRLDTALDELVGWDNDSNPFAVGYMRFVTLDIDGDGVADDAALQIDRDAAGGGASFVTVLNLLNLDPALLTAQNFTRNGNHAGWSPNLVGITVTAASEYNNDTQTLVGSEDADTITGSNEAENIFAYAGADIINAGGGNDTIYSGGGNDVIFAGAGADHIEDAAGDDEVHGGSDNDSIFGGVGNDTVFGDDGADNIYDNAGDDSYDGGEGEDIFHTAHNGGGIGGDRYTGGGGVDTFNISIYHGGVLSGGAPLITDFVAARGGDVINLQSTSFLTGLGSANPFIAGYLRLIAVDADADGSVDDTMLQVDLNGGGDGAWVNLVAFANLAPGDLGSSMFRLDNAAEEFSPNNIGRTVAPTFGAMNISGTRDDDTLSGGDFNDVLQGLRGDDQLFGNGGGDTLYGGDGNDALYGGAGNDSLQGDNGDDQMFGGAGNDVVTDEFGADTIDAGDGNDTVYLQTNSGSAALNQINLGAGDDQVYYLSNGSESDLVTLGAGRDTARVDAQMFSNASVAADTILDFQTGATGDVLEVSGIMSLLQGFTIGSDPFATGHFLLTAADIDADGSADDTLFQVDRNGGATAGELVTVLRLANVIPAAFSAWNFSHGGRLYQPNPGSPTPGVTYSSTGSADASINGSALNDVLTSGDGNDSLNGGMGNDILSGGYGNDTLRGNDGFDQLFGGDGDDSLTGGGDLLSGGDGNNFYYVENGSGTVLGGAGEDRVFLNQTQSTDTGANSISLGGGTDRVEYASSNRGEDVITLGAGRDNVLLANNRMTDATIVADTITDFVGGRDGDWIDLSQFMSGLTGISPTTQDPFVTGHMRLIAADIDGDGADDVLLQADRNGGATEAEFVTVLRFRDALVGNFEAGNFLFNTRSYDPTPGTNSGPVGAGTQMAVVTNTTGNVSGTLGLLRDAYDPDGATLTATLVSGPAAGVLAINANGNDYSFNATGVAPGVYTFTYNLSDGVTSQLLTGTITVLANNSGAFTRDGSRGNDSISGNEGSNTLNGGAGGDSLNGNGGDDVLNGGDGNDNLNGGAGLDTLNGGDGDDNLDGGQHADTLDGGDGDDTLSDSSGGNIMSGGAGNDHFLDLGYQAGVDTVTGGAGRDLFDLELFWRFNGGANTAVDIVTDFQAGPGGDFIFLQNYTSVFSNFDFGRDNPFVTGHLSFLQSGADTILRGDIDGSLGPAAPIDLLILQNTLASSFTIDNLRAAGLPYQGGPNPAGGTISIFGTTELGDSIQGTNAQDSIVGQGGSDTLFGNAGNDQLLGEQGNDSLYGGTGDDQLVGGEGNDNLRGDSGNDTLDGGDGDDTLDGSQGDDLLSGGAGDDIFNDSAGNNILDGGDGDDQFNDLGYQAGVDTVTGGAGRDLFDLELFWRFNGGANTAVDIVTDFQAGPGGDIIYLQNYTSSIFAGIDITRQNPFATGHLALVQSGADTILRGDSDGSAGATAAVDLLLLLNTTASALTIANFAASGVPNEIGPNPQFALGPLVLTGTAFGDSIDGSNDGDTIYGDPDLTGAAGRSDTLRGHNGDDDIFGLADADQLHGGNGNDRLFGGDGRDTIFGDAGNDQLYGEADDDTLRGGSGADLLLGGAGSDSLDGEDGADELRGADGDDSFGDYRGDDVMYGDAGNDYFEYALYSDVAGNRTITGGSGSDLYDLYGFGLRNSVIASLRITDFQAGANGDVLRLRDMSNLFTGWDGTTNPFTQGFLGFTVLDADADGSADDARFWYDITGAGDGAQLLTLATLINVDPTQLTYHNFATTSFGAGAFWDPNNAAYSFTGTDRPDDDSWGSSIDGSLGNDELVGGAGAEQVNGLRGNDTIYGGSGGDTLHGNEGHDSIFGEDGKDVLHGDAGNDMLDGGEGNDDLFGGAGNDIIYGGAGDDYFDDTQGINQMFGGAGADYFASVSGSNSPGANSIAGGADRDTFVVSPEAFYYTTVAGTTGYAADIITDFSAGAGGDILDLSGWSSGWLVGWSSATNPFAAGYVRFLAADADGDGQVDDLLVQGDRDGTGSAAGFSTGVILLNVNAADIVRSQVIFSGNRTWSQSGADGLPESLNDNYATTEDTPLNVAVAAGVLTNDNDPQNDPLSAILQTGPGHGTLTLNADGSFTYTPFADFSGTDSFTYRASDGVSPGNLATVTIFVDPANDAPVANANNYNMVEGTTLTVPDGPTDVLANDFDPDFDPLTAVLVSGPAHGTLTLNANGSFVYTPTAGYAGTDSFSYRANDGTVDSAPATVTITIASNNVAPVGTADSYAATEDNLLVVAAASGVLANDSDANGDPLTAELVSGSAHGTVTLAADGSFTFAPNANFNGSTSFVYRANDGDTASANITVTINVAAVNDAPTADADGPYAATEDTLLTVAAAQGVLAGDGDVDGDALTAVLITGPASGTLTLNADGSFTYQGNANFTGADSFTYAAQDPSGAQSAPRTIVINVAAQNDAPVGVADSYSIGEDAVLTVAAPGVMANDSDADGDTLTPVLNSGTIHGTLLLNTDGSFTYTPFINYNGTDSFTYYLTDGSANSAPVTVTINVTATNDAPMAVDDSGFSTPFNTAIDIPEISLIGNDVDVDDGDMFTLTAVGNAVGGTVTLAGGVIRFTPTPGFSGTATFDYTITDLSGASDVGRVTITVGSNVNDAPVAVNDSFSGSEDNVIAGNVLANDTDADGDPLGATLVSGPAHGTLVLNGDGTFTYTPDANYFGSDSFTYRATDGSLNSDIATVSITLDPQNDGPVANADSYTTRGNTALLITAPGLLANDSDVEGDTLTITSVDVTGLQGTLTAFPDGHFNFTPTSGFAGLTSFTYTISDGNGGTATATATINVVNARPDAVDDSYAVHAGNVLTIAAPGLLANDSDADGDAVTITSVDITGLQGTLNAFPDGHFEFTPAAGFVGTTSFTYNVADGFGGTDTATVTIDVTNANPVAAADSDTARPGLLLAIAAPGLLGNDSDADGDTLTITSVDVTGLQGTLTAFPDGHFNFTSNAGFTGLTSFTYTLSDGVGGTNVGTVTINVVNANPDAVEDSYTVQAGSVLTVAAPGLLANDSDGDGDSFSVFLVDVTGLQGTLTPFGDGSFSFTPRAGFTGVTSFTYTIIDDFGANDTATVTIKVSALPNRAPISAADSYSVDEDGTLIVAVGGVLDNDSDPDGDGLAAALVSGPTHGTLALNGDGTFTYTPDANYFGVDSFTYRASDGVLDGETTTVTINVNPVNDAPVATDDGPINIAFGTATPIPVANLIANDTDIDGGALTILSVQDAVNGTVSISGGVITFTPAAGFSGPASFTYTVSDGFGGQDRATVSLNVAPDSGNPTTGTAGDDILYSTAADENFNGLGGTDMLSFIRIEAGGVTMRIQNGSLQNTGPAGLDSAVSIENLQGTRFDDRLYGNNGNNLILGDDGADFLSGLAGDDTLNGEAGDDRIDGGIGNDAMDGGLGTDTLSYLTLTTGVTVSLAIAGAQDTGAGGIDTATGFENLGGSRGDDHLTGDGNANEIKGGTGNDRIFGGGGADQLFGDGGDDIIDGGLGLDVLGGGAGTDIFVFTSLDGDRIKDFGAGDMINVAAFAGADYNIVNIYGRSFVYWDTDADGAYDDGHFVVEGTGFDASRLDFTPLT